MNEFLRVSREEYLEILFLISNKPYKNPTKPFTTPKRNQEGRTLQRNNSSGRERERRRKVKTETFLATTTEPLKDTYELLEQSIGK